MAHMSKSGQRIGYIRVSTVEQNTARQLDGQQLDRIFEDKASGRDTKRPALAELLRFVREGDTVVVHSMDRLGRNVADLRRLVDDLTGRGVRVEFVQEGLTFDGGEAPMSRLILNVLGAVAEFARAHQLEAQREGIAKAKAAGKYKGRPPLLKPAQVAELQRRVAAGEKKTAVAEAFGISRRAIYDYLSRSA